MPKHNYHFAMSFLETNADKWNLRVKPPVDLEGGKQPENQLLKTWEEEEETDAGNAASLVEGETKERKRQNIICIEH